MLTLRSISKSYAGVRALQGIDFNLVAGEVHALAGENGAGKSTLVKILTGAVAQDSGTMHLNDKLVEHNTPQRARALGIAAIYQQPALFPDLTVAENIALFDEAPEAWRRIDWAGRRSRARQLLAEIEADLSPDEIVASLSLARQQLVEIAKALGAGARVLILDEPTAALTEREAQNLFRIVGAMKAKGVGVIYISHRLPELFALADRITVLRDGQHVVTRAMQGLDEAELVRLMVGRALTAVYPARSAKKGDVVLESAEAGCRATGVHNVSFQLRAGEVLGLSGLVGSKRTELAQMLFGLNPADAGEIRVRGSGVKIRNPAQAIALGVALVPEDRRRHGVVLPMSIAANTTLASLREVSRGGFLQFARERALAEKWRARFSTKADSVLAPVETLSGGNQQKVSLARWLATNPSILILDEPTQGIDVGAKAEIHRLIADLAAGGLAILLISSDLLEILGMSDRVAVMRQGTIAVILDRADATQQNILEIALGKDAAA